MSKRPGAVILLDFLSVAQEGEPHLPRFYVKYRERDLTEDKLVGPNGEDVEFSSNLVTLPETRDVSIVKVDVYESDDESYVEVSYVLEDFTVEEDDDSAYFEGLFFEHQNVEYEVPTYFKNQEIRPGDKMKLTYKMSVGL